MVNMMEQYQQPTPDIPKPARESQNDTQLVKELQQRVIQLDRKIEQQQQAIDRLQRQLRQLETNQRITQHKVFRNE